MGSKTILQKHEREVVRHLRREFPHITSEVRLSGGTHKKLLCTCGGCSVEVPLSSTPRSADHLKDNVRQEVRRAFRSKGVNL